MAGGSSTCRRASIRCPRSAAGYIKSSLAPALLYGDVPVAYAKIAPSDNFSISAGKLPTLIGDEYTFTFENMNIQRGLLWNQEPAISDGVQANWSSGPLSLAVSVNDGFYSKRLIGSRAWFPMASTAARDTLAVIGGGNLGDNPNNLPFATPVINNGSIFNLIYTHTSGPWTISPYLQYVNAPSDPLHGALKGANSTGGALLVNYAFDDHWKLAARGEYAARRASAAGSANMLIAGPGSNAWSLTLTPTYQYKHLLRAARGLLCGRQRHDAGICLWSGLRSQLADQRFLRNRRSALRREIPCFISDDRSRFRIFLAAIAYQYACDRL